MARVRAATHHAGVARSRLDGQSETRLPDSARDMVLTAINQLWRADITYIRLRDEFVLLAVILDAYSRRTPGNPRVLRGSTSRRCV